MDSATSRFRALWAVLLCAVLAFLCGLAPLAKEGDGRLLDQAFRLHQRLGPRPAVGPGVVIVGMDEASAKAIPEPLGIYHRPLGLFMEAMAHAEPLAVGFDVVLPSQSFNNAIPGVELSLDGLLGRGLLRLKDRTRMVLGKTVGNDGELRPIYPGFITLAGADRFAYVLVQPDEDRVVRRIDTRLGADREVPTLAGELARSGGATPRSGLVNFAVGAPFHYVPLIQVLDWLGQGREDELRRAFQGRIVLLGSVIPFEDRLRLPVRMAAWEDASTPDSPGVLLQAQIVRTFLAGAVIRTLPPWSLLLLAALGALAGLGAARRPLRGILLLLALLAATAVFSYVELDRGWFLPITGLSTAALLAYGARLLTELLQDRFRKKALEKELVFARIIEAKNEQLEASNHKLQEAQTRISELMQTHGSLLEDVPAWASSTGGEIQRAVASEDMGIYQLQRGQVLTLKAMGTEAPEEGQLRTALLGSHRLGKAMVVPAVGLSGDVLGVVVVSGHYAAGSPELQLLQGFASQLGSALEMVQVRQKLVAAEGVRGQTLEELHARGIATTMLCPRCGRCYPHTETVCAKDGAELEVPGILPLQVLGRYQLVRRLGEGGMGTVYEATDLTLKRSVAVKLMRPDLFRDPRSKLRFERETRTLVQAQHPHVVTVYDSGELDDGSACLVMERLQGMDLGEVIATFGHGTPRQVAQLLLQAGEALEAAHHIRIVHRDLKPQNLFLVPGPDGFTAKILDFGLAKFQEDESKVTQTGFLMGTPAYMAPEQVLGQDADERSDLFSFATVIYEALVGAPPLSRFSSGQILSSILGTPPTPPSQVLPWLPPEVDDLFLQALAKLPGQRPPRVLPWAKDLAKVLEEVETTFQGWPREFQITPYVAKAADNEADRTAALKSRLNTNLGTREAPPAP